MPLYVCFDDSASDPTYIHADAAMLVESDVDAESGNPCAYGVTKSEVSVLPRDAEELEKFASLMGWEVATDNDGMIVLHTGVTRR